MCSFPTRWSAEEPVDPDRVRRARDDLLARGLLAPVDRTRAVPAVIERSWRRCVGEAVPTAPASIRHSSAVEVDPRLREAAAPVLDRLSEHLGDVPVAMFLSNERGEIVVRQVHEPGQRTVLDRASAAEGFDFSETSIGTNALGTVIEERRPVVVRGSEHYNDLLERVTCAGTPIYEPFTRRVLGSFSLACTADEASPLMYAIATDVGRQIETNLTAMLGAREQALIRAYLMADQAGGEPVIVVNERTVFANTAGLPHLTSESHALLWTHLRERPPVRGPVRTRVPLQAGWRNAVVEPVGTGDGEGSAYCIRVVAEPAGTTPDEPAVRSHRARAATGARPAGESAVHPVPEVHHHLVTSAEHGEVVALDGGPGTGKMHTALALLRTRCGQPAPLVLDVATFAPGEGPEWFRSAVDALDAGRAVVLRHLQDLAPADVNRVKAIAERARAGRGGNGGVQPVPLVVTVDLQAAPEPVSGLLCQLSTIVELPALRELRQQIPDLVAGLLAALPGAAARTRFSSDALQALLRWSWPGNVAELRRLVESLAHRHPGGTVRAADLPTRLQQAATSRQLSLMETAEREAIVAALRRCGGNRRRAAEVLGIGRTTLYRKMQQHHLTV
jgi:sigma-54 dependent transcriptional regulator, acetoin dehydrogenase operon transcriptional activator AcoR